MFFRGKYYFLSNFYPAKVVLHKETYWTVEHAYQAAKTSDPALRGQIRLALSPGKAKRIGKTVALRDDWSWAKIPLMHDLLRQKFQHKNLREMLLSVEGEIVEENWWGDTFWGRCNGIGENHLGRLLMLVRDEEGRKKRMEV